MHPLIIENFRSDLLSIPAPRFRNDSTDLRLILAYFKEKYRKKCRKDARRLEKFDKMVKDLEDQIERIEEKEKELKAKGKYEEQVAFLYFRYTGKNSWRILHRLIRG